MLNILWVEDEFTGEKQITWFGDREVDIVTNFIDAIKTINNHLDDYDLIVLDINLENTEHSNEIKELAVKFDVGVEEFLRESGMNIYSHLLEHGFPKDQIIFLTANADINISRIDELRDAYKQNDYDLFDKLLGVIQNNLDEDATKICSGYIDKEEYDGVFQYLEEYFSDLNAGGNQGTYNRLRDASLRSRIEAPDAINKDSKQHLQHWLSNHEKNDYLVLRRGIIEGCNYLKYLLESNDVTFPFNGYIEDKAPEKKMDPGGVRDYLEVLRKFVPLREPDVKASLYKLFVRTLAHEWDATSRRLINYSNKDTGQYAFAWTMKITRNWMAHSKLFDQLTPKDVAYLFIVNMRAMFKLGNEVLAYEKQLLKLFSKPLSAEYMKTKIGKCPKEGRSRDKDSERRIPLEENYAALLKLWSKKGDILEATNFHAALNDLQIKKGVEIQDDIYITGLYQIFWFLTSNGKIRTIDEENEIKPRLEYQFEYFPYNRDYLFQIARHIYNRSFTARR